MRVLESPETVHQFPSNNVNYSVPAPIKFVSRFIHHTLVHPHLACCTYTWQCGHDKIKIYHVCSPLAAIICSHLANPKNGAVTLTGIRFMSVATYSCSSSFQLVGQESITCQEDGEWSGEPPVCIQRKAIHNAKQQLLNYTNVSNLL